MSERELDSSINDYIEMETPKNYVKQQEWDMAIGLQEVDNLKPSKYLEKLLQENVTGEKTIYEVEHELKQYYVEKDKTNKTIQDEFECDLVSTRIVQLLEEDNFELSVDYIKYIHGYLFKDVYEFAGEFRKVDFSKHERILNNDSVAYGDCKLLEQSLDYDISLEKNKKYTDLEMILHSDQGSVYCSKRFNESLYLYNIIHSTSKPGSPTENGAMEAINGWIKEELFIDFSINCSNDIHKSIENYIHYLNYERPQCALKYLTPIQYKDFYYVK